ncbi:1,4-alpha-glucan branching protein GlgB [Salinimonas sp. HHU 13199]|uniref:1,4-alpha-glucan branching enzyme GlgB n=1 Tax=Salinimonas profundi TaxID=2729140 RepID=A0ABR8LDH5_9ALTE|nr:1,4-alpha-glucan branching protein GlgB [Salinimonas profundi]MBD3584354.1 1,4-alpha-glucan branching protein GlgB [Salinimonas profundi]
MHVEQQLARAGCTHPFSVLGPVETSEGVQITVWRPDAESVTVCKVGDTSCRTTLERTGEQGLFSGEVKGCSAEDIYQVIAHYGQHESTSLDPYQFQDLAYHAVHFIDHAPQNLYQQAGAHCVQAGDDNAVRFCVYAPNASAVSVIGDFNQWDARLHPMEKTEMGYWVLVVPQLSVGERYKFQLKDNQGNDLPHKADPMGYLAEQYPSHASVIYDHSTYDWHDENWMKRRGENRYHQPMSIYEVHLGSWRKPDDGRRYLTYHELADTLIPYATDMGYTHLELLPVSEFPFDGSWGYQPVGLFAPTSRFGNPDDFKYFVDKCHQAGLGVIIDWVPAHFPEDGHGLARFDGSHVYEYDDPRKGWHPDWNSCIYDFGKDTVRQFLVANALFWLDKFHIDGLRVDAVASMLYLDYSRNDGEWIPNVDGGNQNYEAISLLRWMNEEVYRHYPGAMTIAEESTSFPGVSRPTDAGGLGFGFKWNMGWMHDSLHFMAKDPAYRRYHHDEMTFSMVYAFDENFVLPLSHDEVVHGKGSILGKMPGDEWQATANQRAYAAFMFAHPGKKLNFMGIEIAQYREWNHDSSLDWHLLDYPKHQGMQRLYKALNSAYTSTPALYQLDHEPSGFHWIDHHNAQQSVLSFCRKGEADNAVVVVVCNMTPMPREQFRVGVPKPGTYSLLINTDEKNYWGSGFSVMQEVASQDEGWNGQPHSIEVTLPPLATVYWQLKSD